MKPKTMVLMLVAVGCGLVAAVLVAKMSGGGPVTNQVKYLYAKADKPLKPGDKLEIENFDVKEGTQGIIPNAITYDDLTKKDDKGKNKYENRVLTQSLDAGAALTEAHVKELKVTQNLNMGYVAMSIPVRIETCVSGLLAPSSRVNLICTYQKEGKKVSITFLKNVEILAVGTELVKKEGENAFNNPTVLTLAVTDKQAQQVAWAKNSGGDITLTLRNANPDMYPKDSKLDETSGISVASEKEDKKDEEKEPDLQIIKVLVAKDEIKPGTKIASVEDYFTEDQMTFAKESKLPVNYVKGKADKLLADAADPHLTQVLIKKGDPLLYSHLGKRPAKPVGQKDIHYLTIRNGLRDPYPVPFERVGPNEPWKGGSGFSVDNPTSSGSSSPGGSEPKQ